MKYILYISLAAFLMACKTKSTEKDPEVPAPATEYGYVRMHLHTFVGMEEVDAYNISYTNEEGRRIKLSRAQLYISGIEIKRTNGTYLPVNGKILLKDLATLSYYIDSLPVGTYAGIRFKVGLPPEVNSLNPSQSNDSLILKKQEMWFGSVPQPDGFIFANFQGKIDTTAAMDALDSEMVNFDFRIGTNDNLVSVEMPDQPFVVQKGLSEYIHLYLDVNNLFNGLDLTNSAELSVTSVSANSGMLATKIKANLPSMFKYE
jgi:hypothetical protein